MNANPSPGNKAGGLTTILEKSLGAMAKAGSTNLVDVVSYAEPVTAKGFVFMDTPGYDPVSATGQVAGGANLVCFTTGRGSVFGCKPAPSIKLATNTPMYQRMEDDMDVNCGTILDGDETRAGMRPAHLRADAARGVRRARPRASSSTSAPRSSRPGCSARRCSATVAARRAGGGRGIPTPVAEPARRDGPRRLASARCCRTRGQARPARGRRARVPGSARRRR